MQVITGITPCHNMNSQLEPAVHHQCATQNGIQTFIPHTSQIKYYFLQNAEHLTHSPEVPLTR